MTPVYSVQVTSAELDAAGLTPADWLTAHMPDALLATARWLRWSAETSAGPYLLEGWPTDPGELPAAHFESWVVA
jgi:hypothetical protein